MKTFGVSSKKYARELAFWQSRWEAEDAHFQNDHYEHCLLSIAGETDDSFCQGRIVADLGCGPRGSLEWARSARLRIGIDVLAREYTRFNIRDHNMCYVCSGETSIPLPSNYVDVLFTLNAMDHMDNFSVMCGEALRILAPGGIFVGSFNLNEAPSECEPQMLTEDTVNEFLLKHLNVQHYRLAPRGPKENKYSNCYTAADSPMHGARNAGNSTPVILWVRATKP
ncbi:MAG: class I SAM-dependent methyltransferase [Thermoguttaceae bacterium]|jgi:SAM-dependent methyltransferase|nr:class I SAM-dependent methyltransferase [Thermoguttaceae bacterium]